MTNLSYYPTERTQNIIQIRRETITQKTAKMVNHRRRERRAIAMSLRHSGQMQTITLSLI